MEFTSQELAGLDDMYGNGELTSEDIDVLTEVFGVTLPSPCPPPPPAHRRQPKRPLRPVASTAPPTPAPAPPSHILTEMPPMQGGFPQMSTPGNWVLDLTSEICTFGYFQETNK
jgi:hypothetical protein